MSDFIEKESVLRSGLRKSASVFIVLTRKFDGEASMCFLLFFKIFDD